MEASVSDLGINNCSECGSEASVTTQPLGYVIVCSSESCDNAQPRSYVRLGNAIKNWDAANQVEGNPHSATEILRRQEYEPTN